MSASAERLLSLQSRIAAAAQKSGRSPEAITLVGVTKMHPFEQIEPFFAAGLREFGENRVQEALGKFQNADASRRLPARFHLIGPLQSNKAKKAVQFFDMIQTLDRLDLAQDLNRHAGDLGKKVRCLVEIKISPEDSKAGLAPERLDEFLSAATRFSNLTIEGLMGIPPATATGEAARPWFAQLRALRERARLPILSMGMSSDFEVAIEEGATMVRIGSVLFGARG